MCVFVIIMLFAFNYLAFSKNFTILEVGVCLTNNCILGDDEGNFVCP